MDNNEYDDDELYEGITEHIMPFLRIYISAGKENHDLLSTQEIVNMLTADGKSVTEHIKDILDKGMVNVYACCFNEVVKVL